MEKKGEVRFQLNWREEDGFRFRTHLERHLLGSATLRKQEKKKPETKTTKEITASQSHFSNVPRRRDKQRDSFKRETKATEAVTRSLPEPYHQKGKSQGRGGGSVTREEGFSVFREAWV